MKQILSFLFVACFFATLFGQTIVSTTPSDRNMVLEEFTGKTCQYCPDGHKRAQQLMTQYPGRFFAINVHTGSYASGTPNYTTPYGTSLASQAGMGMANTGYPAGTVNRQAFTGIPLMGSSYFLYDRSRWTQCAAIGLAEPSCLNVAAAGTLDVSTRHLTLLVEVYYTGNATQTTNKLTVAMLQNEILGPQTGASTYYPEMMVGNQYRHMHMLRDFITGTQWGMDVSPTTTGSFWSHTFEYDIPQHFNNIDVILEDLEFIVFVAENEQKIITGAEANVSYTGLPPVAGRIDGVTEIPVIDCTSDANAYIKIRNTGQNTLTSAEINYTIAGGTPNTFVWNNREIASMASDTVYLPNFQVQINQNQIINVELAKINGEAITLSSKNLTIKKDVVQGAEDTMKLIIRTDQYGSENSFKIFNPDGTILIQGGPFTNAAMEREFDFIPIDDGCYRLEVYDAYGDGIPGGYVRILNSAGTIIYNVSGSSFSTKLTTTVPVDFTPPTVFYTITASAGENGTISPVGEVEMQEGDNAEFIFTPDENYEVDEVLIDGNPVEFENNAFTFLNVDKDYTIHVTFKMIVGIKDINGVTISIAPNPVNDILFIKGQYDNLEVFSITGQIVATAFNQPSVDVKHLSKGTYFVKISSNGQTGTFKIVK